MINLSIIILCLAIVHFVSKYHDKATEALPHIYSYRLKRLVHIWHDNLTCILTLIAVGLTSSLIGMRIFPKTCWIIALFVCMHAFYESLDREACLPKRLLHVLHVFAWLMAIAGSTVIIKQI
jgi:hypothetical protein